MKKNILLVLSVFLVITSCTSEDNESQPVAVSKVKAQIMDLAESYNICLSIDDARFSKVYNRVNLDSLDMLFKAIASIRGTYHMTPTSSKEGYLKMKQGPRTRSGVGLTTAYESYQFPDNDNIQVDGIIFRGECSASWAFSTKTGIAYSATVDASVHGSYSQYSWIFVDVRNGISNFDYSWRPGGGGSIYFDGEVEYTFGTNHSYKITIPVSGWCEHASGEISWG